MSRIDFSRVLLDRKGQPAKDGESNLLLSEVCCVSLLSEFPAEHTEGGEKHRRYLLWRRLSAGGTQEVTAEEVSLLKRLIGLGWGPLVVGQAWEMLESPVADVAKPVVIYDESGATSGAGAA